MGGLFGGKKKSSPKPQVVSAPAVQNAAEVSQQKDDQEAQRRRAMLASNVLFGDQADATDTNAANIKKKQLLGE